MKRIPDLQLDVRASVAHWNAWYLASAHEISQREGDRAENQVRQALHLLDDLRSFGPASFAEFSGILPVIRMCTSPTLAVDLLSGLSGLSRTVLARLEGEEVGRRSKPLPVRPEYLRLAEVLRPMVDPLYFPWLAAERAATEEERRVAITAVAVQLRAARTKAHLRNLQEARQLGMLEARLATLGYRLVEHPASVPIQEMEPGTYALRPVLNIEVEGRPLKIPVDCAIQPLRRSPSRIPLLIEAKSAGDFTNPNKRRKEEVNKMYNLRGHYGAKVPYILLLGGYFDEAYLSYVASAGCQWVWEHRLEDFARWKV